MKESERKWHKSQSSPKNKPVFVVRGQVQGHCDPFWELLLRHHIVFCPLCQIITVLRTIYLYLSVSRSLSVYGPTQVVVAKLLHLINTVQTVAPTDITSIRWQHSYPAYFVS